MCSDLLKIHRVPIRIPGLIKSYRFLHITDANLCLYDERETPARAEYAAPRYTGFAADGVLTHERLDAICQYVGAHSNPADPEALDGVLITGDILDFPSEPNCRFLQERLAALPVPYVFTLGNHDWAYFDDYHTPHSKVAGRPLFSHYCDGNTFVHKKCIGELTFVAVDNTEELYEDGVAETLAEALEGEENVLMLQHIPLYSSTLHGDTVACWGRDLCVGGCEGICKNDNWRKVLELITADASPVKALITGHLHFYHEDLVEERIPQYVTATAADGRVTLFMISGE